VQVWQQLSQQSHFLWQRLQSRLNQLSFSQHVSQQVSQQLEQLAQPPPQQAAGAAGAGAATGAATGSAPASQALVNSRNAAFMNVLRCRDNSDYHGPRERGAA
jgi:hypothetical protein